MRNSKFLTIILSLFIFSFAFAKSPELVIGIDTSGSMSRYAFQIAEIVKTFRENVKTPYQIYTFNSTAKLIESERDISIGGGTYPSTYLERVVQMNKKPRALILITDGLPASEDINRSYELIKKLKKTTKICSILLEPSLAENPFIKQISDEKIIANNLLEGIKKCLSSKALKMQKVKEQIKRFDLDKYLEENSPMAG